MLIAVVGDGRGDNDEHIIETPETDETIARTKAYLFVYEGHANPNNAKFPPNQQTLNEYTRVVKPVVI